MEESLESPDPPRVRGITGRAEYLAKTWKKRRDKWKFMRPTCSEEPFTPRYPDIHLFLCLLIQALIDPCQWKASGMWCSREPHRSCIFATGATHSVNSVNSQKDHSTPEAPLENKSCSLQAGEVAWIEHCHPGAPTAGKAPALQGTLQRSSRRGMEQDSMEPP